MGDETEACTTRVCISAKSTATAIAPRRCNGVCTIVNYWLLSQNITANSAGSVVYCEL